jgi:Protein of unknown function (DUF2950)
MVSGNMVGGFALVAYPAQYRSSGLMTFRVNHQGAIYEKDLGSRATDIALEMTSFNPDGTWRRVKHAVQLPITPALDSAADSVRRWEVRFSRAKRNICSLRGIIYHPARRRTWNPGGFPCA